MEYVDVVPDYEPQREARRGGHKWLRGRHLTFPAVNGYQSYALEQFANSGAPQFSARVNAPADSITDYVWICAWVNTESWPEAAMAAQEFDRRLRCGEALGEHELTRRKA